jgi:formylglycine-generating enzyme required for sulfatase activity
MATNAHHRFPGRGSGLYDMIGNVWESTAKCASAKYEPDAAKTT